MESRICVLSPARWGGMIYLMQIALRPASFLLSAALAFVSPPALFAQRAAVEAQHGMVTSVHELASQAGVEKIGRAHV